MSLALLRRHHLDLMMINITHAQRLEVILYSNKQIEKLKQKIKNEPGQYAQTNRNKLVALI